MQGQMVPIVEEIYENFLRESADVETREYSDPQEEVEANLVHASYLSLRDLAICASFDVNRLAIHPWFQGASELHAAVCALYEESVGRAALEPALE